MLFRILAKANAKFPITLIIGNLWQHLATPGDTGQAAKDFGGIFGGIL